MRWRKKKEPEQPTPVSAEVAEAMINEAITNARESGQDAAAGFVVMSGPEAAKFLERMLGEGELPDELREFFERDLNQPGDETPPHL